MGEKPLFIKRSSGAKRLLTLLLIVIPIFAFFTYFIGNKGQIGGIKVYNIIARPAGELAFIDPRSGNTKDNIVILVLGLDENRDEKGIIHHKGSRTDTIFLLGLDKKAGKLGVVSIPRDTWIHISDKYGENRINTAYGEAFWDEFEKTNHNYEKAKHAGIAQATDTIENFLGVQADYYVILKIEAAAQMVDALGGITVDVEKDMDYDDNWGHLHIHLKKGRQRLNGADSVGYARFRHDEEGDWGRIRRQQQVIQALIEELKKPTHIMDIDRIAKVIKDNIETDIDLNQLIDLARVYKEFDRKNIVKGVVVGEDELVDNNMVIRPNEDMKVRVVNRVLKDPSLIPNDKIWIRVLNGCGLTGLGAKTADLLRSQGYVVVEVENAEKGNVEATVLEDHFINRGGNEKLKKTLGLDTITVEHKKNKVDDQTLDFTLVLGKDMEDTELGKSIKGAKEEEKPESP